MLFSEEKKIKNKMYSLFFFSIDKTKLEQILLLSEKKNLIAKDKRRHIFKERTLAKPRQNIIGLSFTVSLT